MTADIVSGGHRRIRPFSTADTYPEQNLGNDLCQAVVAGNTVYLRGQVAQDLDTSENVAVGDAAGQAQKVCDNILLLLAEAGARPEHIVSCHIYLTDIRHREPVYRVMGERLRGVFYVSTGLVVQALARPEWLVEVGVVAVLTRGDDPPDPARVLPRGDDPPDRRE
jgi:enamine deaminase RidA (YjgF/YER057c/UK114 family)